MAEIRSCGVLIYRDDPSLSFLLMRHPTRWDLPKGHVDDGESDLECALRELEEETGITRNDIELDEDFRFVNEYLVRYMRHGNEPKLKRLVLFLAKLTSEIEIVVTEHEDYQWFDWRPPHKIQKETIDPLLAELAKHWQASKN